MSIYQIGILVACGLTALVSWGNLRALGWIAALVICHAVSVAYWHTGLPYAELTAALCDAAVCLLIYAHGRYRWEMAVWRMFQVMVAVNGMYLAGNLGIFYRVDHDVYSSLLEAVNILILLTIGGVAILQRVAHDDGSPNHHWRHLRGAVRALRRQRKALPFWRVR